MLDSTMVPVSSPKMYICRMLHKSWVLSIAPKVNHSQMFVAKMRQDTNCKLRYTLSMFNLHILC